jgi:hypothetical protein
MLIHTTNIIRFLIIPYITSRNVRQKEQTPVMFHLSVYEHDAHLNNALRSQWFNSDMKLMFFYFDNYSPNDRESHYRRLQL